MAQLVPIVDRCRHRVARVLRGAVRLALVVGPTIVVTGGVALMVTIGLGWPPPTPTVIAAQAMLPLLTLPVVVAAGVAAARRQRVVATVGCAVVLGSAVLVLPTVTAASTPEWARDSDRLTVYSANVFRENADPARAFATALRSDADVVVFNEYRSSFDPALRASGLLDEYGTVVSDRRRDQNLLLTRLPVASTGVASFAGFEMPTARVLVGAGEREVLVAGVHTQAPHSRGYVRRWERHLDGVAQAIHGVDGSGDVVAVGDFNASIWNPSFRRLFDWGFVDAHAETGAGLARTWGHRGFPVPLIGIDHAISRGPSIAPLSIVEGDVPGSDHRSILVTYAVA